jgi:hypothetical protein
MIPTLVNSLWRAASLRQARRFERATRNVAETQAGLLAACLARNQDTEYGRRHGFATLRSPALYQERVPLTTYDDYAADVERLAAGEPRILTRQPVLRFVPSSGSTAPSKLIPYTAELRAEFRRGLAAWVADLYAHDPQLLRGPAYWSVTPVLANSRRTAAGIPVGFDEDSGYLGPLGTLVESTLAVPGAVKHLQETSAFRYATLLFLLRAEGLRLISVWNPTFLTLLLAPLREWWEPLLRDLAAGTLESSPAPVDPAVGRRLARRLRPAAGRARALARLRPEDVAVIWPRLRLISCWADGAAAPYAEELRRRFPHVPLQPKGLLATEAFVSVPRAGFPGAVLAVTAHFFEFLTASGEPRLAHQLEKGSTYEVVVTTGGGFYRYRLHDLVEVVGFAGEAPCLRFAGKTDQVSDWFGEKLNEGFVAAVLERLFARHQLRPSFALLAPEPAAGTLRYALYLELPGSPEPRGLSEELDRALCESFHYAYCRRLGQLAPPRVAPVTDGAERYLRACRRQGRRLGDVKPAALHKDTHWGEWLEAPFAER